MVVPSNECLILLHSGALAARAGARGAPSAGGRGSAGGDAKILQTKAEGLWGRGGRRDPDRNYRRERDRTGGSVTVTTGGRT